MTGPKLERSSGDGWVVGETLFGDATALMTGALMGGTVLAGDELGTSLADCVDAAAVEVNAAGDEPGGLPAPEAE